MHLFLGRSVYKRVCPSKGVSEKLCVRAHACVRVSSWVCRSVSSVLTSLLAGFYNQHFSICQIQVISEGERMATVISVFFTSQSLHYRVKVPVQSLPRKTFTISLPPN